MTHAPQIVTMAVKDLKPAPYNPRTIDKESLNGLEQSIDRFGSVQLIVFNKRSGLVVGGHQQLKVLKRKKIAETNVVEVDLDDVEERALNVALNNPAIAGEFTGDLQSLLESIRMADDVMFRDLRLDELLEEIDVDEALDGVGSGDPDHVPATPKRPVTKTGDVYTLGNHRLFCGDSTNEGDVGKLLNGRKADLCLTDPPYSVGYVASFSKREKHGADLGTQGNYRESEDAERLLERVLTLAPGLVIMTYPVDRHFFELAESLKVAGFTSLRELVWVKSSATFHPGATYQQAHEPVLVLRREGVAFPKTVPKDAKTVFVIERTAKHDDHPTERPMELWSTLLSWHSKRGNIVHDPFGGSGTTMIAAEMLDRACYAMELAPAFCDVIVQRWQEFTGKKAIRGRRT